MRFEQATPEQIGLYLPSTRAVAAGSVLVRYKRSVDTSWNAAHPLLRIDTANNETDGPTVLVDGYAGTIFDLVPGTQYDIELTHVENGQPVKASTVQRSTRALPAPSAGKNKSIAAGASAAAIQSAFNTLVAGDVLEIGAGTYTVSSLSLNASGSSGSPITIRGASRAGVVLVDTSGTVLTIAASNVIVENLTIQGSGVDSGTAASSHGIQISGNRSNVTIRQLNMVGVDTGITGDAELTGALVYDCDLRGNNPWSAASNGNATWNDDGINVAGFGNCVWNNTLKGFGDTFAVNQSPNIGVLRAEGIYIYRNRVLNSGDDLIEFDYGTRNIACYDNLATNCGTAMSSSYQYGGPTYFFRNIVVNTIRGPYKINGGGRGVTGFLIYNNTVVRTEGRTGWGMIQPAPDGAWRNYSFRNNLLVYRGSGSGGLAALEQGGNSPCDFDYNAWFPNESVWWTNTGGSWSSLAAAKTALASNAVTPLFGAAQRMAHDLITVSNPFVNAITLGATHDTEYTATPDATLSASGPKNLGVHIAGITDGFSGTAPDIGAVIAGRPVVSYGAAP